MKTNRTNPIATEAELAGLEAWAATQQTYNGPRHNDEPNRELPRPERRPELDDAPLEL